MLSIWLFAEDCKVPWRKRSKAGRSRSLYSETDPRFEIGEIFAANEFYDYNAKYENSESQTAVVTDLDPKKEAEIRETAVSVYETMGCTGLRG